MGKSSLIIVMGMSAIVAFFILRMNGNSKESLSTTVNMFEQTQARLIANAGVEIYLEKLYADTTLNNTTSSWENLFNGTYQVNIVGTLPNVTVTSTARFQGVEHTSVAEAFLEPITFPLLPGGMNISTNSVINAKEVGSMYVSGLNHDANGVLDTAGREAVWGIGVETVEEQQAILDNLLKPENIMGLTDTLGHTGEASVGVVDLSLNWGKIYQYLANAADQTFIQDIPNGTDLGTLANPKITLVNADASISKTIIVNGDNGVGIMVINGNVKFAGNFTYKGIILCYKNTDLTFESTGTNQVIGGIIVAGRTVSFQLKGNMSVLFSEDTIGLVRSRLKSNGYKILSWYE